MAELSYPTAGGGSVTDARYEQLIGAILPSGIIGWPTLSQLVYADSTGRQVKVQPSRAAIVRGFHWETDGAGIIRAIAANTSGQARVDLAVLRLNRADWTVTFQVIQGVPAVAPVAPTATQQTGSTGVWELPLAKIRVANGASTLTAANVEPLYWYVSPPNYSALASQIGGALQAGGLATATDTGRMLAVLGGSIAIVAENGANVSLSAAGGWGDPVIKVRRRNGFTYLQAFVKRTSGALSGGTDTHMFNLPAEFRPVYDIGAVAYYAGHVMKAYINAGTGNCTLSEYPITIPTGAGITVHPVTYPSLPMH